MPWIELKIKTTAALVDDISHLLTELGSLAITTEDAGDQPIYEPDPNANLLWDNVIITGLFDQKCLIETVIANIKSYFPDLHPQISPLADQEWERTWMEDFKPMQFGARLRIIPSYLAETAGANEIILDPGLAFGTGKHPTTALCLQWLDHNIKGQEVVTDYGCGSGILGIAALKLGAKKVYAIDHDPQAILATRQNAAKNHLSDEKIVTGSPSLQPVMVDIIMANILAKPLMELVDKFANMLVPKGMIVLSGILENQLEEIIAKYTNLFEILNVEQLEEWGRIDAALRN